MSPKHATVSKWQTRLALIVTMATSALLIYFISEIDRMINVQLYSYGLQFSTNWWAPYHFVVLIVYACLGAIMVLSGFSLLVGFQSTRNIDDVEQEQPVAQVKPTDSVPQVQNASEASMQCPNCGRVFTKPIVVFSFERGKATKLVNGCPYCKHILGKAENEK